MPADVERRPVAVEPGPAAQQPRGPGDEADPPVAEPEQVLGGRQAAGPVGGADRRRRPMAGTPAGSMTTVGHVEPAQLGPSGGSRSEVTRMTPVGGAACACSAATAGPRRCGRWIAETTVPTPVAWATSSTPRMISTAHGLSRSLKTRSISPEVGPRAGPAGRGSRAGAAAPRPARGSCGETSERPLTTRDTVGTETPAARAIAVIVTRRRAGVGADPSRAPRWSGSSSFCRPAVPRRPLQACRSRGLTTWRATNSFTSDFRKGFRKSAPMFRTGPGEAPMRNVRSWSRLRPQPASFGRTTRAMASLYDHHLAPESAVRTVQAARAPA